jgi:PHP domain
MLPGVWACGDLGWASSHSAVAWIVTGNDWAGHGQWIAADLHMHSTFSDGAATVDELVGKGAGYGCQAMAITDHGDRNLQGASPDYELAIASARIAHPGLIILSGLEWNLPPWGGQEHAGVLVPEDRTEGAILAQFKSQFDDYDRDDEKVPSAEDALRWLANVGRTLPVMPVVIYNHPSRVDATSDEIVQRMVNWRGANDLMIGFEGGPGHQGHMPIGSYSGKERTIDRWDPVAASPGGAWDTLLARGLDVYAAVASSDFHNDSASDLHDYWPCQFAETWLYVPEKTSVGVLKALRAGTFFGVHGHIARDVELTVSTDGLAEPATVGESVSVPAGATVTATVGATIPATDWQGQPNHLDAVEFIVVTPGGTSVLTQPVKGTGRQSVSQTVTIAKGGAVIRARGRRIVADGPDLMFYTNAIRVIARP